MTAYYVDSCQQHAPDVLSFYEIPAFGLCAPFLVAGMEVPHTLVWGIGLDYARLLKLVHHAETNFIRFNKR